MKNKFLVSILLAGTCAVATAQEAANYYTPKWTDNIFVSVGVGGMAVINNGVNTPTANINVSVGKYITPTWGVRAQVGGLWQSLDEQEKGFGKGQSEYCKKFVEGNLDMMLNVTNLFGGYNPERVVDFYIFAGPTMNVAKAVNSSLVVGSNGVESATFKTDGTKARLGATAGLGLGFNLNEKWALNVEGRFGVTPSIFGEMSACRKAEATGRLTVGATYVFGGKKFAKVEDRVVEKEVLREVVKEVPKEVVKEVVKEVPGAAEVAIFFKIGKAVISEEGMVNVKLMAKTMKANPNTRYKVAGFADKSTGTESINRTLSEKRAQAVYDALVAEGVNANQLEKVAMGGTDNMFGKNYLNRVVILEVK